MKPRPVPQRARAQLAQQLTMADVCRLLADVDPGGKWLGADGEPTPTTMRRAKRRLRRAEQQTGQRLVFGGGLRRSGVAGGGRCWTTRDALRRASLLDEAANIVGEVRDCVEEIYELIDTIDARQRALARAVKHLLVK